MTNTVHKSNLTPIKYADATQSLRHVFVRDLMLDSSIGIYDHEKQAEQKIRVNIDLSVTEDSTPLNDDYDNVVCYEKVVNGIKNIVSSGHVELVETLAENIADMNLIDPRVVAVRVRVEKLEAIEHTTSVGVEIERRKK
ncbi:dihydroneopterin aldolase [Pseudemcibacter aquimaris]|uniref:dihydroneopterin aldolase n=1 Tax=Pseudemcibacter aquimaris TaxID=2857064 RepID=UPI002012C73D|nr:dihydroneopterin aldolase [Pseudemcibacter aquimaris]MCC3859728.1 dihydroneopterin aldolase [Pseudemcibacter aquimaris]WDU60122.1 dihydroneopterin aldolase [Pseudemcibacter aquimaris]